MSNTAAVSIKEQNKSAASSLMRKNIRKFMNNKLAVFGLVVIVVITVMCIAAPLLSSYAYDAPDFSATKAAPNAQHIFGTDNIGRDLFARVLQGGRISIFVGLFCSIMTSLVGIVLGAVSGYFGGKVDAVIIRISEIFQAFPQLVLVMILVGATERGLGNLIIVFVLTGWMTTFRMIRNEFMSLKNETYVKVCEAFGMSKSQVMFKQILPNVMSPIIVATTTNVAFYILQEASLSFIGLGVPDKIPTWGNILNAAKSLQVVTGQPWMWIFPGLAITLFVLAINFLGDGLRDVLDPKQL